MKRKLKLKTHEETADTSLAMMIVDRAAILAPSFRSRDLAESLLEHRRRRKSPEGRAAERAGITVAPSGLFGVGDTPTWGLHPSIYPPAPLRGGIERPRHDRP